LIAGYSFALLIMFLFSELLFFIIFMLILLKEEREIRLQMVERALSQKTHNHQNTEWIKVGACLYYVFFVFFLLIIVNQYTINLYLYYSHRVI